MTWREIVIMACATFYVFYNEWRWWQVRRFAKAVIGLPAPLSPVERERIERESRRAAVEEGRDV